MSDTPRARIVATNPHWKTVEVDGHVMGAPPPETADFVVEAVNAYESLRGEVERLQEALRTAEGNLGQQERVHWRDERRIAFLQNVATAAETLCEDLCEDDDEEYAIPLKALNRKLNELYDAASTNFSGAALGSQPTQCDGSGWLPSLADAAGIPYSTTRERQQRDAEERRCPGCPACSQPTQTLEEDA